MKKTQEFKKGAYRAHPYSDPTYLSFSIMFDWKSKHSPLFNGEAVEYLKWACEDKRALDLEKFKKYLSKINKEMPWFWQSLSGLETSFIKDLLDPFTGGSESIITINCLETIDLTISGIFDLYRSAVYDFNRMVEVLPKNLREFNMYVTVTEIRNIQTKRGTGRNWSDSRSEERVFKVLNEDITGDYKPRFVLFLEHCQFDKNQGSEIYTDISNVENKMVTPILKISYKNSTLHDSLYLNAFDGNLTSEGPPFGSGGNLSSGSSKLEQIISLGKTISNMGLGDFLTSEGDKLKEKFNAKLDGARQGLVENLINQGLTIAEATVVKKARDKLSSLLLGNVYGANTLSNIQDTLNAGSLNAVANLIKTETNKSENSSNTSSDLGNIYT